MSFVYKFEVSSFKNAPRSLKKRQNNRERVITQLFKKKKHFKKLNNLHMATENINPNLWICICSSLTIIPDLQKKVKKRQKIT